MEWCEFDSHQRTALLCLANKEFPRVLLNCLPCLAASFFDMHLHTCNTCSFIIITQLLDHRAEMRGRYGSGFRDLRSIQNNYRH